MELYFPFTAFRWDELQFEIAGLPQKLTKTPYGSFGMIPVYVSAEACRAAHPQSDVMAIEAHRKPKARVLHLVKKDEE